MKGSPEIHFPPVNLEATRDRRTLLAGIGLLFLQTISAIMMKVRSSSDIVTTFSGEGDVVVWQKKVRLVMKLQKVDDVASLLPLYLEGDALALDMEIEETSQRDAEQIEAWLKEAFTNNAFTLYGKLTMVKWASKCKDIFLNKIKHLIGLPGFKRTKIERLAKLAFIISI